MAISRGQRRGRGSIVRPLIATVAALALGVAAAAVAMGGIGVPSVPRDFATIADSVAVRAGFMLVGIAVRGHHHTSQREIVAALAIEQGTPILRIDTDAARMRVERLPWVKTAIVNRVLPDGIAVEIAERKAAAVWRRSDRDMLIDMEGRELSEIARGSDVGLPILAGEGAGPAAASILGAIASHGEIARHIVETHRIAGRRWTLRLAGGTLVHLPGEGADAAIAWLDSRVAAGLVETALAAGPSSGIEAIDLRVPGQLVVRRPGADRLLRGATMPSRTALVPTAVAPTPVFDEGRRGHAAGRQ